MTKRLLITASNDYNNGFQVVPVNSQQPIDIESDIGVFSLVVNIKNFDGSSKHASASLYNLGQSQYLNGATVKSTKADKDDGQGDSQDSEEGEDKAKVPNLRILINFQPKKPIKGSELLFGNDFLVPIRSYVPTTLLSTGLKFFTWFINGTVKGDIYNDKPFLYGLGVNSFTFMGISSNSADSAVQGDNNPSQIAAKHQELNNQSQSEFDPPSYHENLNSNDDNALDIPSDSNQRRKFFLNQENCDAFVFNPNTTYTLQFDSSFLSLGDSKYAVSIPTFGNKTFDIDVSSYANDELDNFNWTVKYGGFEGVGLGTLGLVLNFALVDEKDEQDEQDEQDEKDEKDEQDEQDEKDIEQNPEDLNQVD